MDVDVTQRMLHAQTLVQAPPHSDCFLQGFSPHTLFLPSANPKGPFSALFLVLLKDKKVIKSHSLLPD